MKNSLQFRLIVLLFLFAFCINKALAQEQGEGYPEKAHKHSISLILGHTHVPKGLPAAPGGGALIIPSWGLNYDFRVAKNWTIGIHADMEITTYVIEASDGTKLERERPTILSVVLGYRPWKGLVIGLGFGNEFETHQNFLVYRFSLEYAFEFSHDWEIAPGLTYDIKESTYDSWTIGLGVVRRF